MTGRGVSQNGKKNEKKDKKKKNVGKGRGRRSAMIKHVGGRNDPSAFFNGTNVLELDLSDFNGKRISESSKLKGKEGMIMAYASWCGHCQSSKGDWKFLSDSFMKEKSDFKISALHAGADIKSKQEAGDLLGIEGYPTIYVHDKNGVITDYDGGRDVKSVLEYTCGRKIDAGCKLKSKQPKQDKSFFGNIFG